MGDKNEAPISVHKRPRSRSLVDAQERPAKTTRRNSDPHGRQIEFQHKPLDLKTASIRLVQVLPLDPSGFVQCRIRHATTEADYACVSYVWGSPKETYLIYIDGKPFRVRRNIWEFLKTVGSQIRSEQEATSNSPLLDFQKAAQSLWIDALCIDQDKNEERNHQVQQMGRIFSSAQCVIAWFGKRPQISDLFRYMRDDMQCWQFFDAGYYLPLHDFCKDVYWRRAWITQEVQLARQVLVLAGTEAFDMALLLSEVEARIFRTFGEIIYNDLYKDIDLSVRKQEGKSIVENIYLFGQKECSDPLDLVYSILSISTDGPELQVKYGITKLQLVRSVFRVMSDDLCLWRSAQVLRALSVSDEEDYLPTKPFVDVEAHVLEHLDHQIESCSNCATNIDLTSIPDVAELGKVYSHCLLCGHVTRDLKYHIVVAESTGQWPSGSKWRVFGYSEASTPNWIEIDYCANVVTVDPVAPLIHVRLSFEALYFLIDRTYWSPSYRVMKLYTNAALSHKREYGWKLAM